MLAVVAQLILIAEPAAAVNPAAPANPAVDPATDPTLRRLRALADHPIPPMPGALRAPLQGLPPPTRIAEPGAPTGGLPRGWVRVGPTVAALVADDGRVAFSDEASFGVSVDPVAGPGGWFDINDGLMRALGEDPYRLQKAAFLENTFERRAIARARHATASIESALSDLDRYLMAIWTHPPWSVPTRKRILFALWDECAERGNPELIAAGDAARFIIADFVRRWLPPGSETAYSASELAALNRERTSRAVFDPYAPID